MSPNTILLIELSMYGTIFPTLLSRLLARYPFVVSWLNLIWVVFVLIFNLCFFSIYSLLCYHCLLCSLFFPCILSVLVVFGSLVVIVTNVSRQAYGRQLNSQHATTENELNLSSAPESEIETNASKISTVRWPTLIEKLSCQDQTGFLFRQVSPFYRHTRFRETGSSCDFWN